MLEIYDERTNEPSIVSTLLKLGLGSTLIVGKTLVPVYDTKCERVEIFRPFSETMSNPLLCGDVPRIRSINGVV